MTARRGWATQDSPLNRPGWHCDGFGTEDLNYIWSSAHGTTWADHEFPDVSDDHIESMRQFERELATKGTTRNMAPGTLWRLSPFVVHTTPLYIPPEGCMRSFLKISVSNHRYNLIGNSHNHHMIYDWPMFPRDILRNDPHKAGLDYFEA